MKGNMKAFISGVMVTVLLMTGTVAFAESSQMIEAIFGRVKLVVNNEEVEKETLLYNGTTYVPLRAAAEVLGKEVAWNGDTQTAYIDEIGTNRTFDADGNSQTAPVRQETTGAPAPGQVKYYAKYPDVADFASIMGVPATRESDMDTDDEHVYTKATFYYYDISAVNKIDGWEDRYSAYFDQLSADGFEYWDDGDDATIWYTNDKNDIVVDVMDGSFRVCVAQIRQESEQAKTAEAEDKKKKEPDLPFRSGQIDYEFTIRVTEYLNYVYIDTYYRNRTGYTITNFSLKWYDESSGEEHYLSSSQRVPNNVVSDDFSGIGPKSGSKSDITILETKITFLNKNDEKVYLTHDHVKDEYKVVGSW